jgi:hypothetical protein
VTVTWGWLKCIAPRLGQAQEVNSLEIPLPREPRALGAEGTGDDQVLHKASPGGLGIPMTRAGPEEFNVRQIYYNDDEMDQCEQANTHDRKIFWEYIKDGYHSGTCSAAGYIVSL